MVNIIITVITTLFLLIVKSKHVLITTIHFACLTVYNVFSTIHNDTIAAVFTDFDIFTLIIPIICFICLAWVCSSSKMIYYPKLFCISIVLFAFCAIKTFCANNALSMFIYMETSMIPMVLMMLSEDKCKHISVIYQYLIYTFVSACLLLIAIIGINIDSKSYTFIPTKEWYYWLIAFAAAIKLPTFPFHYWVPTVHGKSSTVCSILLASVCLKYSSLIVVRFLLPLPSFTQYIILASVASAVCAQWKQTNLKLIFAYSSIIHMNMYLFIPFLANNYSWFIFSLVAHSITMLLAFLVTDIIKTQRIISNKIWPLVLISVLGITNIPGTMGFTAEMCVFYKINSFNTLTALIMIFLVIVSSCKIIKKAFELKDNVSNYNFTKLSYRQIVLITFVTITNLIVGIIPFFKFL